LAGKQFSDQGSERMKGILRFLKQCARHATVHEKSDITVFAMMQSDALVDKRRLQCASAFQFGVTARGSIERLIVETCFHRTASTHRRRDSCVFAGES
jgi:uncharacterized membrane protein